jgi:hypothetical protein
MELILMVYYDCRDWTESGFSESTVIDRLNNMGDQYAEFTTYFNAHNHDDLYYTKTEADAKYFNFVDKAGDYDKLDGYHGSEIQNMGLLLNGIYMWGGLFANIPANFALCDGLNGTPNLLEVQLVGAGNNYDIGDTGGNEFVTPTATVTINNHTLTESEIPSHYHSLTEEYPNVENNTDGSYPYYKNNASYTSYTEYTGGGQGHNHNGSITGTQYEKSGSYIKLPFIKKVS